MNYTPARRQRENEKNAAARDEGKQKNEQKYHEFKITCDTTGDPGACHSLGEWWSMMRSDFVKAAEIYEVGCFVKSYPQSCLSLGRMLGECAPASRGRRRASSPLSAYRHACISSCMQTGAPSGLHAAGRTPCDRWCGGATSAARRRARRRAKSCCAAPSTSPRTA